MCVCIVTDIARISINRERLPILFVVSPCQSAFAPENLVSRDEFGRSVPRQPFLFSILKLNLVLTYGIPPDFRGGGHLLI